MSSNLKVYFYQTWIILSFSGTILTLFCTQITNYLLIGRKNSFWLNFMLTYLVIVKTYVLRPN